MSLRFPAAIRSPYSEYTHTDTHHTDTDGTPVPFTEFPIDPVLLDVPCVVPHNGETPNGDEHAQNIHAVSMLSVFGSRHSLPHHCHPRRQQQYSHLGTSVHHFPLQQPPSVSEHHYPLFSAFSDIPPPPSLEEQQLQTTQLPPTPPLSYTQPKHSVAKRRRRKERVQKIVPDPECSFCQGDDQKNNKSGLAEPMVSCTLCGRSGHPSCIQIPQLADVIRTYSWRCPECKECEICKAKEDDVSRTRLPLNILLINVHSPRCCSATCATVVGTLTVSLPRSVVHHAGNGTAHSARRRPLQHPNSLQPQSLPNRVANPPQQLRLSLFNLTLLRST
jgi:hypothetical protein